ncbi:hypothetical protein D3C80_1301050 [compost metagenome]
MQSEPASNGGQPRDEIGQFALLTSGPLQPVAQHRATDIYQVEPSHVCEAERGAISGTALVIKGGFLGSVTRQSFMHARHGQVLYRHDFPGIAICLATIRQPDAF